MMPRPVGSGSGSRRVAMTPDAPLISRADHGQRAGGRGFFPQPAMPGNHMGRHAHNFFLGWRCSEIKLEIKQFKRRLPKE